MDRVTSTDFLTGAGYITTFSNRFQCRPTKRGGGVPGEVQLPPSGRSHLLGIEARQDDEFAHVCPVRFRLTAPWFNVGGGWTFAVD